MKVEDEHGIPFIIKLKTLNYFSTVVAGNESDNSNLLTPRIENVYQNSIYSPRKNCNVTSTPKKTSNLKSTSNLDISFLEESILSVSTSRNLENAISSDNEDDSVNEPKCNNDCIDYEGEDNIIQIIPESTKDIVPHTEGSVFGKSAHILINVLGECKLIADYNNLRRKIKSYPHENIYWDQYRTVVSKLEVKIIIAQDNLKTQLKEIQGKRLKNNYVSIDLIPTTGSDKKLFDAILEKLRFIQALKRMFRVGR